MTYFNANLTSNSHDRQFFFSFAVAVCIKPLVFNVVCLMVFNATFNNISVHLALIEIQTHTISGDRH
jgi:hypothetical protein